MNFAVAVVPSWAYEVMPAIITCAGVFIVFVCRPLIAGKVKPNRLYGIRTPLAFSSEDNWYRVNRLGGQIMSRSGVLLACIGLVGFFLSPLVGTFVSPVVGLTGYNIVATILVLATIISAAVRIFAIR